MIDDGTLANHTLTRDEYDLIVKLMNREPNLTELGIFSVMWSEHCGYKSSKVYLKKFPTKGKYLIQGPGENAGVLDIGDGLAVVFKIESHNHPSYIEPYQGAATGVGGILRDIFTMGARPIAVLDSLRFGPLNNLKNRSVAEGVVSGISGYGNSIGVPTVGGEVYFHDCYSQNPLVNACCVGLAKKDRLFFARAEGVGNAVIYVGAKTGRDGIHGATMASAEFSKEAEQKRPNVQAGDPFKEKLLLEACLEAMAKDLVIGIQDMGAAGLTCSTTEMAAKAGTGMEINLDLVPQREDGMNPYEIMLSESQERMLIVTGQDKVKPLQEVFNKWDLEAVVIGKVTDDGQLKAYFHDELVIDIPVKAVVDLCPVYRRPVEVPDFMRKLAKFKLPEMPADLDLNQVFLQLIASPDIADKQWIFRQYDHMVQINTIVLPGADAAVLRLKGLKKGLAITLDGNSRYAYLNPKRGGEIAVAEACRNLACVGATPMGVTNCLNFGNPEKPEIMWQFKEAVEGIARACRQFDIPVTGGNVSLYNETEGQAIMPTPVLGIVGLVDDVATIPSAGFVGQRETIILLGENKEELGGSEYLSLVFDEEKGRAPELDFTLEKSVQEVCRQAIKQKLVRTAHDLSEGGLAVALAECSIKSKKGIGFEVKLNDQIRTDALLFGESQSRIILVAKEKNVGKILALARKMKVKARVIGKTGGKKMIIWHKRKKVIEQPVELVRDVWENSIPGYFKV
ncbi:MAG TPA: phosphoribosylformylglycinamidine synthase subunit PurL [Candidatus Saccharicenans sp.]|nr:phosphoribosylformylglycinamidine synthase subunit PurL [Candidatus Saccharicenans sp.]HRD02271.1 phosphoribosylformylglycinamidine synthase subunit PurL [Candidatus Saccharicenans sp.]